MDQAQEAQFVHNYSKVLVQAWTDQAYKQHLASDPIPALQQFGIVVPKGANVKVDTTTTGAPDLNKQVTDWSSGNYTLYVPSQPKMGVHEGQGSVQGAQTLDSSYCCCCCPCCSCT